MHKLVLLRHGESTWNLENRFTGWTDVDLSERGLAEAAEFRKAERAGEIDASRVRRHARRSALAFAIIDDRAELPRRLACVEPRLARVSDGKTGGATMPEGM